MTVPKLFLSTTAYRRLLLEVSENFHTETGGVLLGLEQDGSTYVIEILDPGPESILEPAYFEYDYKYLTHLANKIASCYKRPIRLLGLWHRHPGSYDTFSSLDHRTNSTYVQICGGKAVSGLVNLDPHFRMTFFQVTGKGTPGKDGNVLASYEDEELQKNQPAQLQWNPQKGFKAGAVVHYRKMQVFLGDGHFPQGILEQKTPREIEEEIREKSQGDLKKPSLGLVKKLASAVAPKPKVPPSERLLELVDPDLVYLEEQPDYSYQLQMSGRALQVHLQRVTHMADLPREVRFLFLLEGEEAYLEMGGSRVPYSPGIVKKILDQAIAQGPEFRPPEDRTKEPGKGGDPD